MWSDSIEDYSWIDDVGGGSGGEFRWALDGFDDLPSAPGVPIEELCGNASSLEQMSPRKRARNESTMGPKSKACREKMRRDRLNDRFIGLSSVLDPGRPSKCDKAGILSDAARVLVQLRSEAQQLKEEYEKLQETIKDLKAEKNELRDEKTKLKADKEKLEQQIKVMSLPPTGFLPHPASLHAAAASASQNQASPKTVPFPQYPGVAMWHWLPPAVLDTSQDTKLWSPNA
uniref:Transcription factor ILR3 n=1 Tax=Anthurium amnicola TaxID=1678845 RepID=A0A1D1YJF3_9ARAE